MVSKLNVEPKSDRLVLLIMGAIIFKNKFGLKNTVKTGLLVFMLVTPQKSLKFLALFNMCPLLDCPASRVSFDLPRKIGKGKETLLTACTIPIEHAPKSNLTEPGAASLSKLVNHQILKFDTEN